MYFLILSYLVFGARIYPKMWGIHRGYNLRIWERYSDIIYLYKGNKSAGILDFWGNIALFIPFAFCLQQLFHIRSYPRLFLSGVACSICIELLQYIFRIGFADINDVLTNSLGAALGAALLYLYRLAVQRKTAHAKEISDN